MIRMNVFIMVVWGLTLMLHEISTACSGVYISNSQVKLFGLNEDFYNYNTIYRTLPKTATTYGIIGFGHSNSIQAIINEKGLCYDGYGAPEKPVTYNNHLPVNDGSFIFEAMTKCETIDEVVTLYNQYYHPWLSNGQIFFADRFGNSIIIEGDTILYKSKQYQICTNFYQSDPESGIPYGFYPCWRYNLMQAKLEATSDYSVDFVRDLLDSVHVENQVCPNGLNSTVYSLIVDQNANKIYVYNLHNYNNVIILDIEEELNKVAQNKQLGSLFVTAIEDEYLSPSKPELKQNYPNPFNPVTVIKYIIHPDSKNLTSNVILNVYDMLGREVATLVNEPKEPGSYEVVFDATELASGMYLYNLTAAGYNETRKMLLTK